MFKSKIPRFLPWTLLAAVVLMSTTPAFGRRKIVERIIARINNEIITKRQFEREREKLRQELSRRYSGEELETKLQEGSRDLLRDMIDRALMVQKAKDLDIDVETDVIKRLDEIRQEAKVDSLEALQKEAERSGYNWEDFKDDIRRQLLMQEVMAMEVGSRVVVSREDARKYFEAHKEDFASPPGVALAQILISSEKHEPEEAEKRAKAALAELEAGQRWEEVVKKYSDHEPTINQGGYIGFVKDGTLAGPIEEAVSKLEIRQHSDLIPIHAGYLILRLMDRSSGGIRPFDEVEQRVMETLYNEKMQPALREYLITLRRESYIYLRPGYVDSGAERPSDAVVARRGQ